MIGCKGGVVNQFHLGIFLMPCDLFHGCQRMARVLFANLLDRLIEQNIWRRDVMKALFYRPFDQFFCDELAGPFVCDWRVRQRFARRKSE